MQELQKEMQKHASHKVLLQADSTCGFRVFFEEIRDYCLCLEAFIILYKDGECVVSQWRHISVNGYWIGAWWKKASQFRTAFMH